jgi:hypothetical protein
MLLLTLSYRCSRRDLAKKYFEQAVNWIPHDADAQKSFLKISISSPS